jgi:hypothetical protein
MPEFAIDQIIELRNEIVDRAATCHAANQDSTVAKRYSAVHATGTLSPQILIGHIQMKLIPVADPLQRFPVSGYFTFIFHESGRFSHDRFS